MTNQTAREMSCALLVESPAGWLLAHATHTPRWDLPKGHLEPGETPIAAALRECLEETGLDFSSQEASIEDLGSHRYLPKKDLHLFRLRVPAALDLSACCCSTFFRRKDGLEIPETDAYAWVSLPHIQARIGKSLASLLLSLGLLDRSEVVSALRAKPCS